MSQLEYVGDPLQKESEVRTSEKSVLYRKHVSELN